MSTMLIQFTRTLETSPEECWKEKPGYDRYCHMVNIQKTSTQMNSSKHHASSKRRAAEIITNDEHPSSLCQIYDINFTVAVSVETGIVKLAPESEHFAILAHTVHTCHSGLSKFSTTIANWLQHRLCRKCTLSVCSA